MSQEIELPTKPISPNIAKSFPISSGFSLISRILIISPKMMRALHPAKIV
jgi:hypothetical protein